LHRAEVSVPAAVLEHRQRHAETIGLSDEFPSLRGGDGERLVDHHRDTGVEERVRQSRVGLRR
jgi:hypothetical protein